MLQSTFGTKPLVREYQSRDGGHWRTARWWPRFRTARRPATTLTPIPAVGSPTPTPATDDWPFLYLRTPFVADYYLLALAIVLLFALLAVAGAAAATGTSIRRFSPHFFVLGSAFLLLETRSLVSFSLLFGTTWLVNALAFFAILASVLVAILINARIHFRRPQFLYAGLFIALGSRVPGAAGIGADRPAVAALPARRRSWRSRRCSSPTSSSATPSATRRRRTWRSPATSSAPWSAARSSTWRSSPATSSCCIVVALLYGLAYLFASRFRVLADRDLTVESGVSMPEVAAAASAG